jgi:hypothetical protein
MEINKKATSNVKLKIERIRTLEVNYNKKENKISTT